MEMQSKADGMTTGEEIAFYVRKINDFEKRIKDLEATLDRMRKVVHASTATARGNVESVDNYRHMWEEEYRKRKDAEEQVELLKCELDIVKDDCAKAQKELRQWKKSRKNLVSKSKLASSKPSSVGKKRKKGKKGKLRKRYRLIR